MGIVATLRSVEDSVRLRTGEVDLDSEVASLSNRQAHWPCDSAATFSTARFAFQRIRTGRLLLDFPRRAARHRTVAPSALF
jgi:hypothetical protein